MNRILRRRQPARRLAGAGEVRPAEGFVPATDLYPFESRWFDSSVGRVHCIDEGQGRPLLLMHGNPDWSFLYRKMIPLLRDDFRCIAMDYPGFGLSDHPDGYRYRPRDHGRVVTELVRHLDLQDAVILGQDWGGPIGMDVFVASIVGEDEWMAELERRVDATMLDKPMLHVLGYKDKPLTTKEFLAKWDEKYPDAVTLDLPTAGHFWQEDEPEKVSEAILNTYAHQPNKEIRS